ncbi:flagellar biosynthesis protein FlgN [Ruegeria sediminis]|uniref:flagellar biosynthesis protein FlgN n=1 Tax=Ruegeria sediminis TaxID=2583820 RepID=UPI001FE6CA07|nr:flagellar biosynthesis protein FlgN [Ruegeria sediminis]
MEDLLDRERKALIAGELESLGQMMREKERLIDALGKVRITDANRLSRTQRSVERNRALLKSASEGIHAVAHRMAELRRVRQGLHTYDAAGQRNSIPVRGPAQLEKKA